MVTEEKTLFKPQRTGKVQNVHVTCKTYNLKLLHFIKTNTLNKT